MRPLPALLALLLLVPLAPATAPPAPPEPAWWEQPLGVPGADGADPMALPRVVLPAMPGDDVTVFVDRTQNEFSIAVNPTDPDNVVAGANDYGRSDAWAGYYTSFDGGATWTHGYLPMPSTYTVSGDPALAFASDGMLYYAGIAFNRGSTNNGANSIFVSKSLDGGRTWTTSIPFSVPDSRALHDKPYIAVAPDTGAVYLTYTHFGAGGGILFSRSLDGGQTWSPRVVLGSGQFSLPVAGNSGEVFVTWASGGAMFRRSLDGGATWSTAQNVMGLSLGSVPVMFRWWAYPVMDVARGGPHAGRLYLAGPASAPQGESDLRVRFSDDDGATWSSPETLPRPGIQLMPWMAIQPDGTVGLAYMDTLLSANLPLLGNPTEPNTVLLQSLSVKGPDAPVWTTQVTTDVPSNAAAGLFWGDYQGLAASPKGFHPAFSDARGQPPCEGDTVACTRGAPLDFGTMRVATFPPSAPQG